MSTRYTIPIEEIELTAIRAQGAGGQNVNKVSNAIHLRFDIKASTLPEPIRERLLALGDQRITKDGVVVLKAQASRSLEANRADAIERLEELVGSVAIPPKKRRPTKPSKGAVRRRLEAKSQRSETKSRRRGDAD
jgi:ribosome-associated protein